MPTPTKAYLLLEVKRLRDKIARLERERDMLRAEFFQGLSWADEHPGIWEGCHGTYGKALKSKGLENLKGREYTSQER